ncbi:hypothetical protein [Endozoicomonas ascidiicola]|uniref:hypothetical protein n=1 Tax=Endozoicomonas ascidiicola TaxID=1698521 RepID=UPI00082CC744|nr:hypothetical protein [Endozoicomonas ascidiicola]
MAKHTTVVVVHKTKTNKKGQTFLTTAKPEVRRVVATYDDGRVKDHTGEVWSVKNNTEGRATYITVA